MGQLGLDLVLVVVRGVLRDVEDSLEAVLELVVPGLEGQRGAVALDAGVRELAGLVELRQPAHGRLFVGV